MARPGGRVLALSGGVGGAKLALGLADELAGPDLAVVVNTGDDFNHLGLHISPDIDTLLYTLSGNSNEELGWGLADESWRVMGQLEALGGDGWFRLGDRDLATHLWRTSQLERDRGLGDVTRDLAQRLGIDCGVFPMTESRVRTVVHSDEGDLPFQHYFVRRQCEPVVSGFQFEGLESAVPTPALLSWLGEGPVDAVIICPSNPFVSVDPVLSVPGMADALAALAAPVIAVSPIVAGLAIKGPAAKMMAELSMPVSAEAVAGHYAQRYPGLLSHFVIDESDGTLADDITARTGIAVVQAPTIMKTREDKRALARFVLRLIA